jgi:hypothetical protein
MINRFERRDELISFREEGVKESLESEYNDNFQIQDQQERQEIIQKNQSDIEEVKELEHNKSERISEKFDSNPDINYKEEEELENKPVKQENEG